MVPHPARGPYPRQLVRDSWRDVKCQWLPPRTQACSGFCLGHLRVSSYFAPFLPCPVLTCVHRLCGPGPLQLCCLRHLPPPPGPAHSGGGARHSTHTGALGSLGPWGQAQSRQHHQIVFLWIGDFTFSMDFAFAFIKYCFKENTWKCSPAK